MRSTAAISAVLWGFSLLLGAAAPSGQPSDSFKPDPALVKLQAKLDALKTLKGRFTQTLDTPTLGRPRVERGTFALSKPGRMRWEYEDPERKLALSANGITWLYLPDERQAYKGSVPSEKEGGAAIALLSGGLRLDYDFTSRRVGRDEAGPQGFAGALVLELKPVKPSEEFERVLIAVDSRRSQIRRLVAIDALDERMTFDFFDLDENPELSETLFTFEAPVGVEVIEQP